MTKKTDEAFALTTTEYAATEQGIVAPEDGPYRQYILGFLRRQKERLRSVDERTAELERKIADQEERILALEDYETTAADAEDKDAPPNLRVGDKNSNCTMCAYLGELSAKKATCFRQSPAMEMRSPTTTWCNDFLRRSYYSRKDWGVTWKEKEKTAPCYDTVRGYDFSDKGANGGDA